MNKIEPMVTKTVQGMNASLLYNAAYSDIHVVVVNDEKIPAIAHFLKYRSHVFKSLLEGQFQESIDKSIPMKCSKNVLDAFLHHIYTFECILPKVTDLDEILTLADLCEQHEFKEMKMFCNQHIKSRTTMENVHEHYEKAIVFGNYELRAMLASIMLENDPYVLFNDAIFSTPVHLVKDYLAGDGIWTISEVKLFQRVCLYVQKTAERENVKESEIWEQFLPEIRFCLMSVEDIALVVVPMGLLSHEQYFFLYSWVASGGKIGRPLFRSEKRSNTYFVLCQKSPSKNVTANVSSQTLFIGSELSVKSEWSIIVKKSTATGWSELIIGVAYSNHACQTYLGKERNGWGYCCNGEQTHGNSGLGWTQSYKQGDTLMFVYDNPGTNSNGVLSIYRNNTLMGNISDIPLKNSQGFPLCVAFSTTGPVELEIC